MDTNYGCYKNPEVRRQTHHHKKSQKRARPLHRQEFTRMDSWLVTWDTRPRMIFVFPDGHCEAAVSIK